MKVAQRLNLEKSNNTGLSLAVVGGGNVNKKSAEVTLHLSTSVDPTKVIYKMKAHTIDNICAPLTVEDNISDLFELDNYEIADKYPFFDRDIQLNAPTDLRIFLS